MKVLVDRPGGCYKLEVMFMSGGPATLDTPPLSGSRLGCRHMPLHGAAAVVSGTEVGLPIEVVTANVHARCKCSVLLTPAVYHEVCMCTVFDWLLRHDPGSQKEAWLLMSLSGFFKGNSDSRGFDGAGGGRVFWPCGGGSGGIRRRVPIEVAWEVVLGRRLPQ